MAFIDFSLFIMRQNVIIRKKRDGKMEFIMTLFVFLFLLAISSILNILLKMTDKKDWIISLLLSMVLSITIVTVLGAT
ncbi:hypothetical protein [Priestia sp. SB1]|uniref:hypothetical protein n=1 Tax=Priestia sp. SB1 TaxID=3132359 RepID=UPI00319E2356